MSLLEGARRLAAEMPVRGGSGGRCYYCVSEPHAPDCPWPRMKDIVAALEALEADGLLERLR